MAASTFNPPAKDNRQGNDKENKPAVPDAMGKVKEAGAEILDHAKETAQSVGHMATEAVSAAGKKVDDLASAAGHELRGFGDTIGKRGPQQGIAGQASHAVADAIKGSGRYMEEAKLSGMAQDVEAVVKNHPIPALLLVFGLGWCVGRCMKD